MTGAMTAGVVVAATVLGAGRVAVLRDVSVVVTWLASGGVRARWLVWDGMRPRAVCEAYGDDEHEAREKLNRVLVDRLASLQTEAA